MSRRENYKNGRYANRANIEEMRVLRQQEFNRFRQFVRNDGNMRRRNIAGAISVADFDVDMFDCQAGERRAAEGAIALAEILQELQSVEQLRRYLNTPEFFRLDDILDATISSTLIGHLKHVDNSAMPHTADMAQTTVTSVNSMEATGNALVPAGVMPLIQQLPCINGMGHAGKMFLLKNIISDGLKLRELVLDHCFLEALLDFIKPNSAESWVVIVSFTIANLCHRMESKLPIQTVHTIVAALNVLIEHSNVHIIISTFVSICYIIEDSLSYIELVVGSGIVPKMIARLAHEDARVQWIALRALANISLGEAQQIQTLLDCGILSPLLASLTHTEWDIRIEGCWLASNIACGTVHQIQAMLDCGVHAAIIENLRTPNLHVQKQALSFVQHFCIRCGKPEHAHTLINADVLPALSSILNCQCPKTIKTVLLILLYLLKLTDSKDFASYMLKVFAKCGAIDKIQFLQCNGNEQVSKYARAIGEQLSQTL